MSILMLVVDSEPVVQLGLQTFFENTEFAIAAFVATAEQARRALQTQQFDVALIETHLPDQPGFELCEEILASRPSLPVILLTSVNSKFIVSRAAECGARGLIRKSEKPEVFLRSLQTALTPGQGNLKKSHGRENLKNPVRCPHFQLRNSLTPREFEVLRLVSEGMTNQDIAKALNISFETVKEHVQHVLWKIGVNDRTQAAVFAQRNQWL